MKKALHPRAWLLYFVHLPDVLWLLLFCAPWVGLQCVIVVFPDYTADYTTGA